METLHPRGRGRAHRGAVHTTGILTRASQCPLRGHVQRGCAPSPLWNLIKNMNLKAEELEGNPQSTDYDTKYFLELLDF